MKTGIKRTLFPLKLLFPMIAMAVIVVMVVGSFFKSSNEVAAQVSFLYASSCLGGWKGVDKVTGVPEVAGDATISYSEENSASLYNKQTQIYCGGFSGQIPEGANRTKVALRFSWGTEGELKESEVEESKDDSSLPQTTVSETGTTSSSNSTTETSSETQTPAELVEPEKPMQEETPSEEPSSTEQEVSWWRSIVPVAFAQEEVAGSTTTKFPAEETIEEEAASVAPGVGEESEVVIASSSDKENIASSSEATSAQTVGNASSTATTTLRSYISPIFNENTDKDNAIFEVLFTMDNEEWYPLGYVSRINNDIQFELPLELFTTTEDFSKLQISLKTIERFDDTPKIYLDSMWLEVSYLDAGEDPLPPPGTKEGDIIMTSISTQETSLVTVFRGVGLETVSNIMSSQGSSTATSTASSSAVQGTTTVAIKNASSSLVQSSSSATSTASTSAPLVTFESDIPYEVRKNLRATPGVEVELWLYDRLNGSWSRVADNSTTATVPRAVLLDNKVFWFGYENTSLWMFDVIARSYSSRSLSPSEPIEIEFTNAAGEAQVMYFSNELERLEAKYSTSSSSSQ